MNNTSNHFLPNEYTICKAYTDVVFDTATPEKIQSLRFGAIKHLDWLLHQYKSMGLDRRLLDGIAHKKTAFIMEATSSSEIKAILEPSKPVYRNGEVCAGGPYHVDEEELIIWSRITPNCQMIDCAKKRYIELFWELLPDIAKEYGIPKY